MVSFLQILLKILHVTCVLGVATTEIVDIIDLRQEVDELKQNAKLVSEQLTKWNNLFLNSATSLAKIESNIENLQGRAHVWDTFQLHVAAWNDQLTTLDRKADIISKGQEKILNLESKINSIAEIGSKMDSIVEKMSGIEETILSVKEEVQNRQDQRNYNILFGEFATRGILETIKTIEKKLDRLLFSQKNLIVSNRDINDKPRLTIKCNSPPLIEELLRDVSSKVDIIFDKMSKREENESDYNMEDYLDDESVPTKAVEVDSESRQKYVIFEKILDKILDIQNITHSILDAQQNNLKYSQKLFKKCNSFDAHLQLPQVLNQYFTSHKEFFTSCSLHNNKKNDKLVITQPTKNGCEQLDTKSPSGVYIFGNTSEFNTKNRNYNKRYCIIQNNHVWTVIQNRDSYTNLQNFNLSWLDYKYGFGDIGKDFWFGNDFISKLSSENNLELRIELEDFDGHRVWAEYSKFAVLPEKNNYQLVIENYRGNASDSFLSHNGSFFSTFDKKNDQAPECCPCAVSYGGGWWFNSCFESNLNGIYHNKGIPNGHYGGIIWENWLGNYSLKKTIMMVKILKKEETETSTLWPYYEDP